MGDHAIALDLALVAGVSVAVCAFADQPALMDVVVGAAIALRLLLWSRIPAGERDLTFAGELAFFGLCVLLGAANDWNTVVRQGVYDYTVPSELPALTSVPVWMLLFWGFVLRLLSSLPRWQRLQLSAPSGGVRSVPLRLLTMAVLVLGTRLCIFRFYAHPIWSWLPFLLAIGLAVLLLRPEPRRLLLAGGVALIGVAVESLYVNVAGLHAYALGWIGGVPVWIALWWALAALLWGELSSRLIPLFRLRGYWRGAGQEQGSVAGQPQGPSSPFAST